MTNVGISLAIIFGTAFGGVILWLAACACVDFASAITRLVRKAFSAPTIRPWNDFADRVNTVPESYAEALQMIPANNDKPVGQFVEWPVITEEQVVKLHGGDKS